MATMCFDAISADLNCSILSATDSEGDVIGMIFNCLHATLAKIIPKFESFVVACGD
jgi:hypothetical protein